MDDYSRRKLTEFVESQDEDVEVEDVEPLFETKKEEIAEKAMEEISDEKLTDYAIAQMKSEDLRDRRVGGSGEEMELRILSIGHRGSWDGHPVTETNTVTAHGIIHAPLADDGSEKAAKAIIFLREEDVPTLEAQQKFHELNELKGTFEVEEAWNLEGFYRAYSTENTELVETDLKDLPSDRDAKNEMLRRLFPDTELMGLAENGDGLSSYDGESEQKYTHDFGADIQRFTGTIVDWYINDENTWGVYTLMDESLEPEDLEGTSLMTENQTIPGLSVHCVPDYHMNFGNGSIVDVYGVTEIDENGDIIMRAAGVVPIVPNEMDDDGEQADEGVEATEDTI